MLGGRGESAFDDEFPVRSSADALDSSSFSGESGVSFLTFQVSSSESSFSDSSNRCGFVRSCGCLCLSAIIIIIMFWEFASVVIVFTWFSSAASDVENGRDWGWRT